MKTKIISIGVTAFVLAVSFTACDKKTGTETPAAPPASSTNGISSAVDAAKDMAAKSVDTAKNAAVTAVDATKDAAVKVTDMAKDAAAKTTETVKNAAAQVTATAPATPDATDSVTAQFTAIVANAKNDIASKNYQGALDELKKLSSVKLSDDQQKIVDGIKAEAQKLISNGTSGAVDAAKGLLGK